MTAALLDASAREAIERCAVARRFLETGGSLFGWKDATGIAVACATGPGPGAKHRPRSFAPAPSAVRTCVDLVGDVSDDRYGYIGSWHTHPRGQAVPSRVDSATALAMSEQEDLALRQPLFLIATTTGSSRHVVMSGLRAWLWNSDTKRLDETAIRAIRLTERFCPSNEMLFVD